MTTKGYKTRRANKKNNNGQTGRLRCVAVAYSRNHLHQPPENATTTRARKGPNTLRRTCSSWPKKIYLQGNFIGHFPPTRSYLLNGRSKHTLGTNPAARKYVGHAQRTAMALEGTRVPTYISSKQQRRSPDRTYETSAARTTKKEPRI